MQNCAPYRCADGACINRCTSDDDCVAGHVCQNGSCGKKPNGQPCTAAGDCASNFCVDGVCCDRRLHGRLPQLRAAVVARRLHAGGRRRRRPAQHAARPSPRRPAAPTETATARAAAAGIGPAPSAPPERCASNVFTPESTCSATGACVAPDDHLVRPVRLQRQQVLRRLHRSTRTARRATSASATRAARSRNGAFCSDRAECISGNCAQGVCCATACASACRSCALSGHDGDVHERPDRRARSRPRPAPTMARQLRHQRQVRGGRLPALRQGTPCRAASCPASGDHADARIDVRRRRRLRDARRRAPVSRSRAARATCKSTCATRRRLRAARTCASSGSCGLQAQRRAPASRPGDCASGVCAQRRLLHDRLRRPAACRARSWAAWGPARRSPPTGRIPTGQCTRQGAASCGTTGFCDGSGGCQLYAAGVQCAPPPARCSPARRRPPCPAPATATACARRPTTQSCGVYACNGTTCNAACGGDADCAPGNVCNAGSCGKKRLGQLCSAGTRMRQQQLRRRRLLLGADLRQLPVVRGHRPGGDVPAGARRRRRAARRLHRQPAVRFHRHVRRQRRLPAGPDQHQLRRRLVQRRRRTRRSGTATATAPATRRRPACAPRTSVVPPPA